ncbi:hypothetical protein RSOLAG1IB_09790 [Rhizoctonia solani AG-1 IB]|uniref:Uncharacterized protein n=1 Tax=Thanatephorus cucumeris (strain AG1-IB / isolate 7/3/14) TaxID=1108050 RepID=A0A0B7FY39_THACB|nr:hypothetical protein RSOLAG1IB_09790 [Rhizoctonia solani AG-1 IB]
MPEFLHPSAPSAGWGSISASSSNFNERRMPMDFGKEWGTGPVFSRYRRLQKSSVFIERLQIRINHKTPPHRFIVAYLQGTKSVCRFDRRPETPKPGTLFLELLGAPTRRAADEWTLNDPSQWAESERKDPTHCELDMELPPGTDLLLILASCYALTMGKARNYELFRYNCYFFSWTIAMVVARHVLPLVPPSPLQVVQSTSLPTELGNIAGNVAERTTDGLIFLVLNTITAVRKKTGKDLNPGLGKRELLVWGLPTSVFCFLLRSGFKLRLRAGLETQLKERVKLQLEQSTKQVLEVILTRQSSAKHLAHSRLWVRDLVADFKSLLEEQIIKVMWGAILDIAAEGYGSPDPGDLIQRLKTHPKLRYRLKYRLFGANVVQFTQIWTEAVHRALPAARQATSELTKDDYDSDEARHRAIFNAAFVAAKEASLLAVKDVVARTSPGMHNSERESMWTLIWDRWDEIWGSFEDESRETIVRLMKQSIEDIVGVGAKAIVDAVEKDESKGIQASITPVSDVSPV